MIALNGKGRRSVGDCVVEAMQKLENPSRRSDIWNEVKRLRSNTPRQSVINSLNILVREGVVKAHKEKQPMLYSLVDDVR